MSQRNFAHTSNYIFGTNLFGEETTYAVQSCNLPGMSFNHIETGKNSSVLHFQGDTINFSALTVEILVDENLNTWKEIAKSMLTMRDPYSGTGEQLETISWLEIHNDFSSLVLKLYFHGSMIGSISDLMFNSTDEDNILTLSLDITYDYYEIV